MASNSFNNNNAKDDLAYARELLRDGKAVRLADASLTDGAQDTAATPRKAAAYVALKIGFLWKIISFCCFV